MAESCASKGAGFAPSAAETAPPAAEPPAWHAPRQSVAERHEAMADRIRQHDAERGGKVGMAQTAMGLNEPASERVQARYCDL